MKLLFIPGSGGGKEEWLYQTGYFASSEAIAFPGRPEGSPCSSVEEYVQWLRDYVHRKQHQDVILVGHSLGGAIAQLYGLKYGGEIKALVLIGTGARLRVLPALLSAFKEMITNGAAWREYVVDIYRRVDSEVRQAVIDARVQIGPEIILNDFRCCDRFDIMDKVHTIKLPTLVICGREDELTPVKYTHYLADKIETAREVIINGAHHWVHMENPREVNQAIESFLASLS